MVCFVERVGDESKPTPPCFWATPDNQRSQQKCRCSGVSRQQKTFSEALVAQKHFMDAVHKSPCVICLGTFVTSAGACDFIGFCFLFLIFGGLRSSTLAMAYAGRASALDHCSILSMQKRYRLTIRFVRNSTGPFWFGPMQLSDFSMLKQNVSFFF